MMQGSAKTKLKFPGWLLFSIALLAGGCGPQPQYRLTRLAADPAGGGDATISPDGETFLATSRRAGQWDVWSFHMKSSRWERLTTDPGEDFEARWSPDGTRIAFTSTRSGGKDVWMLTPASGELKQLTFSEYDDEYPDWSPDGRSVVYTGGPWGARDYFMVAIDGGTPKRLGGRPGKAGACAFEPSGDSLVCHHYESGTGDIFRLRLEDGGVTPLTLGEDWDYKPSVSPDGEWIAFSRSHEGPSRIWVISAKTGAARQLTDSPYDDRWPTWGTGSRLLFHRVAERGTAVKLLDRETGRVKTLVGAEQSPLQASLSPDGARLAFCSQGPAGKLLKILDLQSGELSQVETETAEACYPRWSPEGGRLAFVGRSGGRWEVRVKDLAGGKDLAMTAARPDLHGMDGPVDWSPDGSQLLFHADTEPHEAQLFTVDVESGRIREITDEGWFDEAPSWAPDGRHILFMSTRGGDWTWSLMSLSLTDGSMETLAGPDWEEKNFVRMGPSGAAVWSAYDNERKQRLFLRPAGGEAVALDRAGEGARWPSFAGDGEKILFTVVEPSVEYWLAENLWGPGSPLLRDPREEPGPHEAAEERVSLSGKALNPLNLSTPVDLFRR